MRKTDRTFFRILVIVLGFIILNAVESAAQVPYWARETALQEDLLSGLINGKDYGFEYNSEIPPKKANGDSPAVKVGINVFKVKTIDIATSVMSLNIWIRIAWNDPRLAWNSSDPKYLNVTQTTYKASTDPEITQIWVPELELYNQADSLANFPPKDAIVYPDGSVFWSRVGNLEALCAFSGLKKHPFDRSECNIDLGGWTRSGLFANYSLMDPPISYGGTGTSMTTYQEYGLVKEGRSSTFDFYYPCCPNEPWPTLSFTFVFERRTTNYYQRSLVFVMITFTFLASAVFFFDIRCGERLGYGITILLSMVATEIIAADILPICPELLWIECITFGSTIFAIGCLLESCVVTHIYYKQRKEDLSGYVAYDKKDQTEEYNDSNLEDFKECIPNYDHELEEARIFNNKSETREDIIAMNGDVVKSNYGEETYLNNSERLRRRVSTSYKRMKSAMPRQSILRRRRKVNQVSSFEKWSAERGLSVEAFKLVKKIDQISFNIFMTLYPLFLVTMYGSLPLWKDNYAVNL